MAAPKNNQFWRLRSKHGRDKLFAAPDLLWGAACDYFEWCDSNPWIKQDAVKGGDNAGVLFAIPATRPYTLSGLCVYLNVSQSFWRNFKAKGHEDFAAVIQTIEGVIETHQFEGAAVGAFNANIMSRKLGLADKSDVSSVIKEHTHTVTEVELSRFTPEQLDALAALGKATIEE